MRSRARYASAWEDWATMRIAEEPLAAEAERPRRPRAGSRRRPDARASDRQPRVRRRCARGPDRPAAAPEGGRLPLHQHADGRPLRIAHGPGEDALHVFHPKDKPFDDKAQLEIEAALPKAAAASALQSGPFAQVGVSLGSGSPFRAAMEKHARRDDVTYVPEFSSYLDFEGRGIRYHPNNEGGRDARLPSDFPPDKVPDLERAMREKPALKTARLRFVNEAGDTVLNVVQGARKSLVPTKLGRDQVLAQARSFLEAYLAKHGRLDRFKVILADQMTRIAFDEDPAKWVQTAMMLANEKNPERAGDTEGITPTGQPVGTRCVFMNASNFTARAIVHELLHALSHDAMNSISWIEGLTEYLTLRATGLTIRTDAKGEPSTAARSRTSSSRWRTSS